MSKFVDFHCEEHLRGCIPEPRKASEVLPSYYKALPPHVAGDVTVGTAKRCVPFLEAVSTGFVIPLCVDVVLTVEGGNISWSAPNNSPIPNIIETHFYEQLEGYPLASEPYGAVPLKFVNPWVVVTPKGVSCLFTPCLNHFERRFLVASGIVDTDSYYNTVNLPFVWTGGEGQFMLRKGTPLVQVIPIQREVVKSRRKPLNTKLRDRVVRSLGTVFVGGYRNLFWHKRKKPSDV